MRFKVDKSRIPAAAVVIMAAGSAWAIKDVPGVSALEALIFGLLYMALAGLGFVWIAKGGDER